MPKIEASLISHSWASALHISKCPSFSHLHMEIQVEGKRRSHSRPISSGTSPQLSASQAKLKRYIFISSEKKGIQLWFQMSCSENGIGRAWYLRFLLFPSFFHLSSPFFAKNLPFSAPSRRHRLSVPRRQREDSHCKRMILDKCLLENEARPIFRKEKTGWKGVRRKSDQIGRRNSR